MISPAAEVLLFKVGDRLFAAGVGDVLRIGTAGEVDPAELVLQTSLGAPTGGGRAIVVRDGSPAGEATLVVDEVLGFRAVAAGAVQPLPALATAVLQSRAVTGLVLVDDAPTLLVDLPTLIRERRRRAGLNRRREPTPCPARPSP